jgi:hypothetical protein
MIRQANDKRSFRQRVELLSDELCDMAATLEGAVCESDLAKIEQAILRQGATLTHDGVSYVLTNGRHVFARGETLFDVLTEGVR